MDKEKLRKVGKIVLKVFITAFILFICAFVGFILLMLFTAFGYPMVFGVLAALILPSLFVPLIWFENVKRVLIIWLVGVVLFLAALGIVSAIDAYEESITIDVAPNIDVYEYLPFAEETKIVKLESDMQLEGDLPVIDGAAALFPVYSAYVNAVYPDTVELYDGVFEYNNTMHGYHLLAEKATDVFVGVYPSEEQIAYAEECGTEFKYTPIGSEAFVFFVHKDNPIDNLTSEQIRSIYSGEITNWEEVGGANEEIVAFQRNEGSGSQSMLQRFMGDTPIMEAPTERVQDLMSGIIDEVSDYKSRSNSIGFSYRYYVEGIIQNPDIKLLSVDGVAPTAENVKNESYPIITPLYAVSYEGNDNENVDILLEWMVGEEGQYILEETGYVGLP